MADAYGLLLTPLIIIGCFGIVTSASILIADITDQIDIAFCAWPDYDNGYDETCSSISHPDPYAEDNAFGFPTGWFTFTTHLIGSFLARAFAVFVLVGILLFPVATFLAVPILVIPFAFLYLAIIIGGYKVALPFVGR